MTFSFLTHSSPACALKGETHTHELLQILHELWRLGSDFRAAHSTVTYYPRDLASDRFPEIVPWTDYTTWRIPRACCICTTGTLNLSVHRQHVGLKKGLQGSHEPSQVMQILFWAEYRTFCQILKGSTSQKTTKKHRWAILLIPAVTQSVSTETKPILLSGLEDRQLEGMKGQRPYSI